jgi:hypothetical protein
MIRRGWRAFFRRRIDLNNFSQQLQLRVNHGLQYDRRRVWNQAEYRDAILFTDELRRAARARKVV